MSNCFQIDETTQKLEKLVEDQHEYGAPDPLCEGRREYEGPDRLEEFEVAEHEELGDHGDLRGDYEGRQ